MANMVNSVGGHEGDITENARQQDLERRAQAQQDHYDITGEQLPPYEEHDPLVPISGRDDSDVANDGDTYDETVLRNVGGTVLPSGTAIPMTPDADRQMDSIYGDGYMEAMSHRTNAQKFREQATNAEKLRQKQANKKRGTN